MRKERSHAYEYVKNQILEYNKNAARDKKTTIKGGEIPYRTAKLLSYMREAGLNTAEIERAPVAGELLYKKGTCEGIGIGPKTFTVSSNSVLPSLLV
ncbi:MAG UNVERIFIED_CONTAM: hypothetical protein LVQ98_06055 [Rickettsiaceae bacterium]|jgi:hypothetical protein